MIDSFARAIRSLRRAPGFVAVAVLSLGVGLGLTTATFAAVDSVLHPPLPVADVDRLFFTQLRLGNQHGGPSAGDQVRALRALPGVEHVSAAATAEQGIRGSVFGSHEAAVMPSGHQMVEANGATTWWGISLMSPNLLAMLGVQPLLGRLPTAAESEARTAVVVTRNAWFGLFGRRKILEGARITIGDHAFAVVGVLPAGFERALSGDIWIPYSSEADLDRVGSAAIVVKVRPGVDTTAVNSQLAVLAAGYTAAYVRPPQPPYRLAVRAVRPPSVRLRDHEFELLLLCVAFGILAIACTNVAALALARGLTRRRDYALRLALGASRLSIGGDVLAEVGVIAVLGAAAGLLVTLGLVGVITHMVPEDLASYGYFLPVLSWRVFALTAGALVAGLAIAGGMPAWRASRTDPANPLKDNAGTTTGRSRSDFRLLVMGELAISMVLLMLASLMTVSTQKIVNYDFGYDARRLLGANVSLGAKRDTLSAAQRRALYVTTLDRVRSTPGVAAAGMLLGGGQPDQKEITADARGESAPLPLKSYLEIGPGFLATLGVPIIEGRDFTDVDGTAGGAIILSQRAANALFPHGSAIGRMVKLGGERSQRAWLPVIGIARDLELGMRENIDIEADPLVFATLPDQTYAFWKVVVRPQRADPELVVTLQRTLRDLLPPHASSPVGPWLDYYDRLLRYQRFFAGLLSFLGTAALLLGAIGLFSVLSYAVGQRMREFAVRLALGSTPRGVLRLVLTYAFELALGGTAVGALLSFWASAGVSSQLYGVKNTDPVSLVVAEGTLLLVTLLASLPPAIRAMRADPVEILRST